MFTLQALLMKKCNICQINKKDSEYYYRTGTKQLRHACKPCYNRRYNTEARRSYNRNYSKQRLINNPNCNKEYYLEHKEMIKKSLRESRLRFREQRLRDTREWIEKNKERFMEYQREYRDSHKEQYRTYAKNRKARKRGAIGKITHAMIAEILKLQNGRCVYCNKDVSQNYSVDHILPLSRGGNNLKENIQITCLHCNLSKNRKTHEEFIKYLNFI